MKGLEQIIADERALAKAKRKRPGRPRSAFPIRYQLRLTADLMQDCRDAAERDGRDLQNWMRRVLAQATKKGK